MAAAAPGSRLPRVGEVVLVSDHKGIVRFVGVTEFASGVWVGIELEQPKGKNNGTVKDVTYFTCAPDYGIFVRPRAVEFQDDESTSPSAATAVAKLPAPSPPEQVKPATKVAAAAPDKEPTSAKEPSSKPKVTEAVAAKKEPVVKPSFKAAAAPDKESTSESAKETSSQPGAAGAVGIEPEVKPSAKAAVVNKIPEVKPSAKATATSDKEPASRKEALPKPKATEEAVANREGAPKVVKGTTAATSKKAEGQGAGAGVTDAKAKPTPKDEVRKEKEGAAKKNEPASAEATKAAAVKANEDSGSATTTAAEPSGAKVVAKRPMPGKEAAPKPAGTTPEATAAAGARTVPQSKAEVAKAGLAPGAKKKAEGPPPVAKRKPGEETTKSTAEKGQATPRTKIEDETKAKAQPKESAASAKKAPEQDPAKKKNEESTAAAEKKRTAEESAVRNKKKEEEPAAVVTTRAVPDRKVEGSKPSASPARKKVEETAAAEAATLHKAQGESTDKKVVKDEGSTAQKTTATPHQRAAGEEEPEVAEATPVGEAKEEVEEVPAATSGAEKVKVGGKSVEETTNKEAAEGDGAQQPQVEAEEKKRQKASIAEPSADHEETAGGTLENIGEQNAEVADGTDQEVAASAEEQGTCSAAEEATQGAEADAIKLAEGETEDGVEVAQKEAGEDAGEDQGAELARKKAEEAEAARKQAAEESARRKAEEAEVARKQAEEEAAQTRAEEAEIARKKAEEEAAQKRAEDAEIARKKTEEEAARKKAEEAAAAKRKAEEEAAANRQKAEEEASRKRTADEAAKRKRKAEEIERLKAAVQLERGRLELAKLQVEEAEVMLSEARESMNADDQVEEQTERSEEEKLGLYQEALVKLYDDHASTVKQLKRRIVELEKVETQLKQGVEVKDDSLQQSIEQLSSQNNTLELSAKMTAAALSERRKLCEDADEVAGVHAELEEALVDELQYQEERERQLKLVARSLAEGRERLRKSREEEAAKRAQIEVRLQTAQKHKPDPGKVPSQEPKVAEYDSIMREVDASAARLRAELSAQCIPELIRQDSALGLGYNCLLALQRMARKAEILSTSIMEHYVEDATMLAHSMAQLPMHWLCSASFAGAQCAFAATGIAGRLQACEASEYFALLASPALRGCVTAEVHLDTALAEVPYVCLGPQREPHSKSSVHEQTLAHLCASSAQLVSILRSVFKDHGFASWQTAEHAVRAVQAVCAMALFASGDAGGSRKRKWQTLFDLSWELRAAVAQVRGSDKQMDMMSPNTFEAYIEPCVVGVDEIEDSVLTELSSPPVSPSNRPPPTVPVVKQLSPCLVDALLVQAAMLQQHALCEPPHSGAAADTLDRTLMHAETSLDFLKEAIQNESHQQSGEGDKDEGSRPRPTRPSRLCLQHHRDVMRDKIEKAEKNAVAQVEQVETELREVSLQIDEVNAKRQSESFKAAEVERQYSQVRMAAEQGNLVGEDLRCLKRHAALHAHRLEELRGLVEKEQATQKEAETSTVEMEVQCTELQQQLDRLEERLQKKYMHAHMTPDDVVALELRNSAQRVKLQGLHASRRAAQLHAAGNFVATEGTAASFRTCSQEAAGIRAQLLMEQAQTVVVDLEQALPPKTASRELAGLKERSATLRAEVTSLLRDVSGFQGLDSSTQVRAAVGLTRHLQATALAPKPGADSAMRLTLPMLAPATMVAVDAVQSLGDRDDALALHQAVF